MVLKDYVQAIGIYERDWWARNRVPTTSGKRKTGKMKIVREFELG